MKKAHNEIVIHVHLHSEEDVSDDASDYTCKTHGKHLTVASPEMLEKVKEAVFRLVGNG